MVELNEAFAAQSRGRAAANSACPTTPSTSTPTAGRSHSDIPLGASGARLALTAAIELADRDARRALATMCIGVGQGLSVLLEAAEGGQP